jgi:hypothetical protein
VKRRELIGPKQPPARQEFCKVKDESERKNEMAARADTRTKLREKLTTIFEVSKKPRCVAETPVMIAERRMAIPKM